jgi:hypothetical protein
MRLMCSMKPGHAAWALGPRMKWILRMRYGMEARTSGMEEELGKKKRTNIKTERIML